MGRLLDVIVYSSFAFVLGLAWMGLFNGIHGNTLYFTHSQFKDCLAFGTASVATAWSMRWGFCSKSAPVVVIFGLSSGMIGAMFLSGSLAVFAWNAAGWLMMTFAMPTVLLFFCWYWALPFGLAYGYSLRCITLLMAKLYGEPA